MREGKKKLSRRKVGSHLGSAANAVDQSKASSIERLNGGRRKRRSSADLKLINLVVRHFVCFQVNQQKLNRKLFHFRFLRLNNESIETTQRAGMISQL